jgi:transposase-like protein
MKAEVRQRLKWIRMYEASGNAGLVCRRCGISRPTLRKWWRRFEAQGTLGLESQSRRPHKCPGQKVTQDDRTVILQQRGLGQGAETMSANPTTEFYQFPERLSLEAALTNTGLVSCQSMRLFQRK